jgi:hypothetical protein
MKTDGGSWEARRSVRSGLSLADVINIPACSRHWQVNKQILSLSWRVQSFKGRLAD